MLERKPDEIAEIKRESHFGHGQERFERPVFARAPGLGFAFDSILGRASKVRLMIKNRFEHRTCVVEGKSNPERQQTRQEQNLLLPGARM